MKHAYFLTGTDTEIGKTFITCALLHRASQTGLKAAGLKPVAAGTDAAGLNEDVENIRAASNLALPLKIINPYCFKAAIAPHIAAAEEGITIEFETIKRTLESARQEADLLIVEGVGGFCVPLGVDRSSADLAIALGLPVILVVGLRLGCINHALLTVEAICGARPENCRLGSQPDRSGNVTFRGKLGDAADFNPRAATGYRAARRCRRCRSRRPASAIT
jgi:dethiobiotin synthetase